MPVHLRDANLATVAVDTAGRKAARWFRRMLPRTASRKASRPGRTERDRHRVVMVTGMASASTAMTVMRIRPPIFMRRLTSAPTIAASLIAQPTRPGQFRAVDAFSRIVLSRREGLDTSRPPVEWSDGPCRGSTTRSAPQNLPAGRPIRRMRLIATEALPRRRKRGGVPGAGDRARQAWTLEIIEPRDLRSRLAVSRLLVVGRPRDASSVVLFDIGGGSSEIAVIRIGENRSQPSCQPHHPLDIAAGWRGHPVGTARRTRCHTAGVFRDGDRSRRPSRSVRVPAICGKRRTGRFPSDRHLRHGHHTGRCPPGFATV